MSDILSWLPPNLQPSKTISQIPMLVINIVQIAYLQVLSQKPSIIKYKWWGLKAKTSQQPLLPNTETVHKFYISVSLPMFLRYCADMKILQFQLCDSHQICLARGHINFLLLKGWGGQQCGLTVDLKHLKSNSKIGEMHIKIEILTTQNPLKEENKGIQRRNQVQRSAIIRNRFDQVNENKIQIQKTQKNGRRIKNFDQQQSDHEQRSEFNSRNNFINYRIDEQNYNINQQAQQIEIDKGKKYIGEKANRGERVIDDTKTRWYKKFNLPLPDQCICEGIRPNRYEHEKIKLKQQIQMLFKPNSNEFVTNQQVHVQFMGWQPTNKNDAKLGCKISVPILDTQGKVYRNEHYFGLGKGNIKIGIGTKSNKQNYQNIIQQYLKNNNIEIVVGDSYIGSIPLYKILGSKGDIMSTGIYQTKNKRQLLKGHYLLKLVAQNIPKQMPEKKGEQSAKTNIQKQEINIQNEYIWLYLRQMHFVQPQFWQNSNIYVNVKTPSHEQKTKTIWKSDCPTFNQIITVLMSRKQIVLSFWNRQATQRFIGKAFLNLNTKMQFDVQIPIMDNYNRIVAYMNLCIGKGDIRAATQFLNTHSRGFHQHKPSGSNNVPYSSPRTYPEPSQQPEPEEQNDNENQASQHEKSAQNSSQEIPPIIIPKIPQREQDIQLNILQIHNKIFTQYIAKQYDWLATYQNEALSMAQLSHLLKPILPSHQNMAKLATLYLDAETNSISLKEIRQSFEAFQVYYKILIDERDMAISNLIEALNQQGLSINDIQYKISEKIKSSRGNKQDLTWRALKQYLQPNMIQKIRYFYQNSLINQLCDCLRRFEVYETTNGQQINNQSIAYQISKELSDLLEIDNHTSTLKQAIKQSGLELSKYELLSLFGQVGVRRQPKKSKQIEIGTKMIKSPTFGLLATDRINNVPPSKPAIQKNQSIDMRIEVPSNKSDMSAGLSQKFGHPNISPINQRDKNRKPIVAVKLMDLDSQVQYICVNGEQFDVNTLEITQNGSILIQMGKKFNYQGYLLVEGDIKLEFDGCANQWISLTDQNGQYCGSIIFQ